MLEHFKHIESIESVQKILFQTLLDEHSRPPEKKNLFAIAKLATCMMDNTNLLRMLNIDTPFVKDMKKVVDKVKDLESRASPAIRREPIEGALTIPIDSIAGKPQEWTPEQRAADKPVF